MSRKDYIPDSPLPLRDWAQHLATNLPPIATRISWPQASATDLNAQLTRLSSTAQAVIDAQNALETASGRLQEAKDEALPIIRRHVSNLKTTGGFGEGDAKALDLIAAASAFDPATYQPQLTATSQPGHVLIVGKKAGVDALNLYVRRQGETTWRVLSAKRSHFPYDDAAPSATGVPEVREYRACGVIGDAEVGQPSDIVTAVWQP